MAQKAYNFFRPNYRDEKGKCLEFLTGYEDASLEEHQTHGRHKYLIELVKLP